MYALVAALGFVTGDGMLLGMVSKKILEALSLAKPTASATMPVARWLCIVLTAKASPSLSCDCAHACTRLRRYGNAISRGG